MSWVKIDDQFTDHPKIVQAGPLAGWLYVCGLTYAARYLTDGFIPAGQVRRLADVENAAELAGRLVAAGLWEAADDGYQVHDYLEYQPSADTVQKDRAATAQRVHEWRDKKRAARNAVTPGVTYPPSNSNVTGTEGVCNTDVTALLTAYVTPPVTPPPYPYPSVDLSIESALVPAPARPRPKAVPKGPAPGLTVTDEHRALAASLFVDADTEATRFRDYCQANGKTYKDWAAAFRNWLRNAPAFTPTNGNGHSRGSPPRPAPQYRDARDILAEYKRTEVGR